MRSVFLDRPGPIAFAHRGFAPDGRENSLVAFARAVELGYRYLETDVRVTADGVAIAFHDDVLDRVTDRRGRVSRLPWSTVRQARIGGTEPIPRLAEVLGDWPAIRVNVDVKSEAALAPALEAIHATGSLDRVCVAAFSDRRIASIRQALGPDVCTALAPSDVLRLRLATLRGSPARLGGGQCVQVPARIGPLPVLDRAFVAAAHSRRLVVHAWTVNDRPTMTRLLDIGVDGIMTDRADVLRDVLVGRGMWT